MEALVMEYGYFGLLLVSFVSTTFIPLATEVFVVGMIAIEFNVWTVILVATTGNYLGALLTYYMGLKGGDFIFSRWMAIPEKQWTRAQNTFQRWGVYALFFSWVPIVGDPLTAVAGAFKVRLDVFTFWVILGKALRYLVVVGLINNAFGWFSGG